jgi:sec-independent protein translocase protein TatA
MGLGGLHIWHLLIILVIVLLLFGTKRLKTLGGDLGGAIKGFKKALSDEEAEANSDNLKKVADDSKVKAEQPQKTENKQS